MTRYILKRLLYTVITIWIVITATFFMMRAIPGGPFTGEKVLPPAVVANLNKKFGLDKPISTQYWMYLKGIVTKFDLGPSMRYEGRTVNDVINYSFKNSAKLGFWALLVSLILGIVCGVYASLHQGKWQDSVLMVVATIFVTIPAFVFATLLILLFSMKLGWLPVIGFDSWKNYIMPVISLGGFDFAMFARLTRSSMLDVIRQDYIRTAKAKGLSRNKVIYKHALKNSLIPVITYLGPTVAGILTGAFTVEQIFGIPGLGREFVQSIGNRDYTTTLGVTVFFSTFLILCNLVADILYAVVDPRIRYD
jgi:oligopeptide transport system permease protein